MRMETVDEISPHFRVCVALDSSVYFKHVDAVTSRYLKRVRGGRVIKEGVHHGVEVLGQDVADDESRGERRSHRRTGYAI